VAALSLTLRLFHMLLTKEGLWRGNQLLLVFLTVFFFFFIFVCSSSSSKICLQNAILYLVHSDRTRSVQGLYPNFGLNTPVSHHFSSAVHFDKRRIYTGLISIRRAYKCAFYCQRRAFLVQEFELWISYTELKLSLYKCVFCQIVQRCWSDVKLDN